MDAESTALLQTGATTLVTLMVTDAWSQFRTRLATMFGRRGGRDVVEAAAQDLEESRAHLLAARQAGDLQAAQDIEAEWRSRLRRLLADDPATAAELRAVVDAAAPRVAQVRMGDDIRVSGTFLGPVLGQGTQNVR
uniref:hypothetical protein n=1 Tax=Nonomuraea pusilla TaxID=46177 RepID=UPI0006E189DB|nr:hypothetical protein [Nonomuraea pusilla]